MNMMILKKLSKLASASAEVLRADGSYTVCYLFDYIDKSERPFKIKHNGLSIWMNIDDYSNHIGVSHGYRFEGKEANEPVITYQELKEIIEECNHYHQVHTLVHDHTL